MPTLAIVSPEDRPIYQASFPHAVSGKNTVIEQLVLHSSLDMVDEKMWDTRDMYLKVVDKYGADQLVSAYVTPANYRFLLLHDRKNEDGVKSFFNELHDLFVKVSLNPLYVDGGSEEAISSQSFNELVTALARRYL